MGADPDRPGKPAADGLGENRPDRTADTTDRSEPPSAGSPDESPRAQDLYLAQRLAMVRQLGAAGIHDPDLLAAFGRVPREQFVPFDLVRFAYDDAALGIGRGQTISQPYMVARMTELLGVAERVRAAPSRPPHVLDVGTGSGYQAAILAALGARVVSIERDRALSEAAARRLTALGFETPVRCVVGDGSAGWPADAPYDGIVVGAGAPEVPEPLVAQLADGGRLVIPVGPRAYQALHLVRRDGTRIEERELDPCVFVPLVGEYGFPG